jgi:epoxyqueuosine reductase
MLHSQVSTVNDVAGPFPRCYRRLAMHGGYPQDRHEVAALLSAREVDLWAVAATRPGWAAAPALPTAISFPLSMRSASLEGLDLGPNEAKVREDRRLNDELVELGEACVALLTSLGYRAERVDDDAPDGPADPKIFASKTAATQAGLGWIGKTALLVTPGFGSAVRLGTVFTDLLLPPGAPITAGRCGAFRVCVDACPVGDRRDVAWRAGLPRSVLYDCAASQAFQLGFPEYDEICGICIRVCLFTRRALRRDRREPGPRRKARRGDRR